MCSIYTPHSILMLVLLLLYFLQFRMRMTGEDWYGWNRPENNHGSIHIRKMRKWVIIYTRSRSRCIHARSYGEETTNQNIRKRKMFIYRWKKNKNEDKPKERHSNYFFRENSNATTEWPLRETSNGFACILYTIHYDYTILMKRSN